MHSTKLSIIIVPLLTLCSKGIKQSQFPRETDDSESNFQPCNDKPSTHASSTDESLPTTVCFSFWFMDQGHSPDYKEPTFDKGSNAMETNEEQHVEIGKARVKVEDKDNER